MLEQFEIITKDGFVVKGDIEGKANNRHVIVCSHGFGVERTDRGLFSSIGDALKDTYMIVRFDYNFIDTLANEITVYALSHQAQSLKAVLEYIRNTFVPERITIIAHSMGCIVASRTHDFEINSAMFLAPPPEMRYQSFVERFSVRTGSVLNDEGISRINRSDGSVTLMQPQFLKELQRIEPAALYGDYAKSVPVTIVRATNDEVLGNVSYEPLFSTQGIRIVELDADHNFSEAARQPLIEVIYESLNMSN